jgi:hypothetical protein
VARSGSVLSAIETALSSLPLTPADDAAKALARQYASAIDDDPDVLAKVGPQFLAVLVELGLTPKARAAVAGGQSAPTNSKLDELRAQRAKRAAKR